MITKREFDMLVLLTETKEVVSQRDMAERLKISAEAVNKTVKELTEKNYCKNGQITQAGLDALEPYRVKRAIFVAAGFGSRMVPITLNTPKPLVRVNGTRIIDTLLDAAVEAGIPEIVIVRGYLGEQFDQLLYKYPNIRFVENPIYNEANNISSAVCVRYLLQNAYVLEADLLLRNKKLIRKYEYETIKELIHNKPSVIATGGGTVTSKKIVNLMRNNGLVVFVNRDVNHILDDLDLEIRPLVKESIEYIFNVYEERYPLYESVAHIKIGNEGSITDAVQEIIEALPNTEK